MLRLDECLVSSGLILARENGLNLSVGLAFGFWHFNENEDCAKNHESGKEVESWTCNKSNI